MKDTNFDAKITDLKYHINGLMPETICQSFIRFFEDNEQSSGPEQSYKYQEKKIVRDNFKCMNLSELRNLDKKFVKPFDVAKQYLAICISNYVLHIQNKICPTFSDKLINKTSNIRILRYQEGENIKDHSDVADNIRASCTINLNENYQGGS